MGDGFAASSGGRRHAVGLMLGFGLFFLLLLMPAPSFFRKAAQRFVADQGTSLQPSVLTRSMQAVATIMVPVVIAVGRSAGVDPTMLAVSSAIAASLAFMLPVSPPPNALVYGTGYMRIRDMVRGGVLLDLIGCVFTVVVLVLIGSYVLGVLRA